MIHAYATLETLRAQALSLSLQINDLEARAVTMHDRGRAAEHRGERDHAQVRFNQRDLLQAEAQLERQVLLPLWKEIDALEKEVGVAS